MTATKRKRKCPKWSQDNVVAWLQANSVDSVAPARRDSPPGCVTAGIRHFGSWRKACDRAGVFLPPRGPRRKQRVLESPTVSGDRFRHVAERWLAEQENPESGYRLLASSSGHSIDFWRKRLTDKVHVVTSRKGSVSVKPGLFALESIKLEEVDAFLVHADLVHVLNTELISMPDADIVSDVEYDRTCVRCADMIDWTSTVAGVRMRHTNRKPGERTWLPHCYRCAAEFAPAPPLMGSRVKLRINDVRRWYVEYVDAQTSAARFCAPLWEQQGFKSQQSMSGGLQRAWKDMGLPLRSAGEARRLADAGKLNGLLSEQQVRDAHVLHIQADMSINQIAAVKYEEWGYATQNSACAALSLSFKRLGLKARGRIEMTVLKSTKHGRARRKVLPNGKTDVNGSKPPGYKRWLMDQRAGHSTLRPLCAGVKTQPPRKGSPCTKHSMEGSLFCHAHDPAHEAARIASLARMRDRMPKDLVEAGDLPESLRVFFAAFGWKPLEQASARPSTQLLRWANLEPTSKMRESTASLLRQALTEASLRGVA
jgi:hypothetical protein